MYRLLVCVCGVIALELGEERDFHLRTKRITHGTSVDISSHPHQVALLKKLTLVHCGGALVLPHVVFTAAHCTHTPTGEKRTDLTVLVGANTLDDPKGKLHQIKSIIKHPDYTHEGYDNDFSIVFLKKPAELSERVNTIGLSLGDHKPGTKGTVTGWGQTEYGKPSRKLQRAKVTVSSLEKCQRHFPKVGHPKITENMICVKPGLMSSSFGDSGGPLVVDSKLAGIVSFGRDVNGKDKITVFTKLNSVYDFIQDSVPEFKDF